MTTSLLFPGTREYYQLRHSKPQFPTPSKLPHKDDKVNTGINEGFSLVFFCETMYYSVGLAIDLTM